MKVKSESEVAQSWPTLSDPMDCSPPGSSVHGIFQAKVLEWGAIAFSTLGASIVFPGSDSWFVEERKPGNLTLKARHQTYLYFTDSFCHSFKHLLNVCANVGDGQKDQLLSSRSS